MRQCFFKSETCYLLDCVLSHLYICSLFVQDTLKNGKPKHSHIKLFTVSDMLTNSRGCCLQGCKCSMHNCTLSSIEVS